MSSLFGRRGVIIVASFLIFAASVGSACITLNDNAWLSLRSIRLIGGVGMGLKATSTPILAAETAAGSWRGSSVLLWQLWVSFGIMMSFIVNICLNQIDDKNLKLRLILASPAVFALMLMYTVAKCPESFRYYLMPGSRKYSPEKAYASLLRLRNTKGASLAISINLLFAGLLAWLQPLLVTGIRFGGTLGVFAGLNVVAFALIFLLMEESSGVPLESLGSVFDQSKKDLIHFQLFKFLPWFGRFILGRSSLAERPERTVDLSPSSVTAASVTDDDGEERIWSSDTVSSGVSLADMLGGNGRG
ncbi:related to myo-inositol transport protein ITR1 [Fusarium fujikuroi]|nr:related to myo-inositol transport protein ITR1 [Fusarium fujikuroi]